jgi:hypothetical protein
MVTDVAAAEAVARAYMDRDFGPAAEGFAILGDRTRDLGYGWLVFYNSRRYRETRNHRDGLAGNGPLVVLRDGTVRQCAAAYPLAWSLREIEAWLNAARE